MTQPESSAQKQDIFSKPSSAAADMTMQEVIKVRHS